MGSRREYVLVGLLVAIVVVLAVALAPEEGRNEQDGRASSYLLTSRGTRALFWTLEELGMRPSRRLTPWVEADTLRGPLLLLAPSDPPSPAELAALGRWLEWGNTLVYAARPGDSTLDSLGLALVPADSVRFGQVPAVTATPVPHPWTRGMGPIDSVATVFADTSAAFRRGKAVPLARTARGHAAAALVRRGKGYVLALSDPAPLGNGRLRDGGAALLAARAAAAGAGPGGRVWFDEYHHGFRGDGSVWGGVRTFLWSTPAGWGVLQLAAVGAALLLLLGRRFGAPLPPPRVRRRSPLEHVDALSGAYRQAGARSVARRLLVAGLARRMGRRPLREAQDAGAALEQITTRLPVAREAARELRDEWARGEEADLAELARRVDHLLDEVKRP